jgi:hypothetical protein
MGRVSLFERVSIGAQPNSVAPVRHSLDGRLGAKHGHSAVSRVLSALFGASTARFVADSLLEGAGFEPSVPGG